MTKTVVVNAKILTMDDANPVCSYMLVEGDKIVDVGNDPRPAYYEHADVIDAHGKLVTPGLIDTHLHLALTGLWMLFGVDLAGSRSVSEVIDRLKEKVRVWESSQWLIGYNLNEYELGEKRLPDRYDLDKASPNTPIIVHQRSGHYAVVNSEVLRISGIDRSTPDPTGSRIGRYEDGEPNGVLYEFKAKNLAMAYQPAYTFDDYVRAIQHVSGRLVEEGITTVKEPGGAGYDIDEELRLKALSTLAQRGGLGVRVRSCVSIWTAGDLARVVGLVRRFPETDMFRVIGFKIHHDGSGFARTAWMKEPWNINFEDVDDDNKGFAQHSPQDFRRILEEFNRQSKSITIHAIGDMAIETALDEIERLQSNFTYKSKFSLVHVYVPSSRHIERIRQLGVCVETQTSFIYLIGDTLIQNLGRSRGEKFLPMKAYFEHGVVVGNGSDSPVTSYSPKYGIYGAVTRRMGRPFRNIYCLAEDQKIGVIDALKTYTCLASKCVDDDRLGVIKKGNQADFVIWQKDFTKVEDDAEILKIKPLSVYIAGNKVYEA
jgi:predicted amidohydrolase YtcJ